MKNAVILQYWESSIKGSGVLQDGVSLHFDLKSHRDYIYEIYKNRNENNIPDEYDKIVGNPVEILTSDFIYEKLKEIKSIRLTEAETNNMIYLKDIIL